MKGQIRRIVLSKYGDYLIVPDVPEHCRGRKGMFDLNCDTRFNPSSGLHLIIGHSCGGSFLFNKLSTTHNVLSCNKCYTRIVFPKRVKTFHSLVKWLKGKKKAS